MSRLNTVQLILLVVEGVLLSAILSAYSWVLLQRVARRRYHLYLTFMVTTLSKNKNNKFVVLILCSPWRLPAFGAC